MNINRVSFSIVPKISFLKKNNTHHDPILPKALQEDTFTLSSPDLDGVPSKRVVRIEKQASKALETASSIQKESEAIVETSKAIQENAAELLTSAKQMQLESTALILKAKQNGFEDFNINDRKIKFIDEDYYKTMLERDSRGKLLRVTHFNHRTDEIKYIKERHKDGTIDRFEMSSMGDFILTAYKGYKEDKSTGIITSQEEYTFDPKGNLRQFYSNRSKDKEGVGTFDERYFFVKNELNFYVKNQDDINGLFRTTEAEYQFKDDEIIEARVATSRQKGAIQQSKMFKFNGENLCFEQIHSPVSEEDNSTEYFEFENGKLISYSNRGEEFNFD